MVTGFKDYTSDNFSDFDKEELIPLVIKTWDEKGYGRENIVKMDSMIIGLKKYFCSKVNDKKFQEKILTKTDKKNKTQFTEEELKKKVERKISPHKMRKIFHSIRVSGHVKSLVASQDGYWKSNDPKEIVDYIRSLWERSNSFKEVALSMEGQYRKMQRQS